MNFFDKNVLLIIHQGSLGGAERQGLGLGKILSENYNCQIYLMLTFSGETTKEFDDFAEQCHIKKTFHFGEPFLVLKQEFSIKNLKRLKWSTQYLLRMRKGLKPYKIDYIFPFLNFPSKIAFYLYKLLPNVKFTFWHQLGLDTFKNDIFENVAAKYIPCVIANASNGLELFRKYHPLKAHKSFVLPQYISMDYLSMEKKGLMKKHGIPENSIVIGMIAHFRPEKYHELLLNAFEILSKEHNKIHLVFAGNRHNSITTENKFIKLTRIITEKGLQDKITILSKVKVEEILNILDIGVLISRIEGMPNSVMEYMLYGLPVVATNHPGCIHLLKDSSFLIENSEEKLCEALEELILSKELREMEGKKNSKFIEAYTKESYIEGLQGIIQKVINNG